MSNTNYPKEFFRNFNRTAVIFLCLHCLKLLLGQLGGWKKILSAKVYPVKMKAGKLTCDICRQSMTSNHRSGIERRSHKYEVHIPERRGKIRREADSKF
jgi:hypothetical protein